MKISKSLSGEYGAWSSARAAADVVRGGEKKAKRPALTVPDVLGCDVALVQHGADVEVVVVPAHLDPRLQIVRDRVELLVLVPRDVHHVDGGLDAQPGVFVQPAVDRDLLRRRQLLGDVVRRVLVQHAPALFRPRRGRAEQQRQQRHLGAAVQHGAQAAQSRCSAAAEPRRQPFGSPGGALTGGRRPLVRPFWSLGAARCATAARSSRSSSTSSQLISSIRSSRARGAGLSKARGCDGFR